MNDKPTYEANNEMKSTSDILREQRKRAYEAGKALRKAERKQEKADKRAEKLKARGDRDQELWAALKKGSDEDI